MTYFIISLAVLALDQVSKYFALEYLTQVDTIPLIQGVFHLTFRRNTGAAFSILRDNLPFLIGLTTVVICVMGFFLVKMVRSRQHPLMLVSLSMMFGGAIGNLADRIRLGYVVDYFDFRLINFAVFNVGDSFIVVGAILLGIYLIFLDGKESTV